MNQPNYLDYTINELYDCERNINQEKFPDRYQIIKEEIKLRTERGELPSDKVINGIFSEDVPKLLSLKIWWSFLWRSTLISLILSLILWGITFLINKIVGYSFPILPIIVSIFNILCFPLIGVWAMSQALGKRYENMKIYFRRIDI